MRENIEVLEEVLDVLEEEKRKVYNLVNQNEFRIEEINSYLRELSKKEDEDFKVFSPRNAENIHREQIEADTSEKKKYEEENAAYHKKIDALKVLIDKVNIVIGNLHVFEEKKEVAAVENENIVEDIEVDNTDNIVEKDILDRDKCERVSDVGEDGIEKNKTEVDDIQKDEIKENKDQEYMSDQEFKLYLERVHIAHQILNCISYITPDAERAKIELIALSKKLME